jgi:hypothetical protein
LNGFALPRAIVTFDQHSFVAWNPKFLAQTDLSEEEIKTVHQEDFLTIGDSWLPLSSENDSQKAEYVACAVKRPFGEQPVPGFIIRTHDRIGYVMLDAFRASSAQFEQGRVLGREEERNRIIKAFHDEVSSSIVAALFLMETARTELEQAGLPQAEAVAKASNILTETTEKIADAFSPGEDTRLEP